MKKVKTIIIGIYPEDEYVCCYLVDGDYSEFNGRDLIEIDTNLFNEYGESMTLWGLVDETESFNVSNIPKVIKEQKKLGFKVKVISGADA